jgi:hypothetical protein
MTISLDELLHEELEKSSKSAIVSVEEGNENQTSMPLLTLSSSILGQSRDEGEIKVESDIDISYHSSSSIQNISITDLDVKIGSTKSDLGIDESFKVMKIDCYLNLGSVAMQRFERQQREADSDESSKISVEACQNSPRGRISLQPSRDYDFAHVYAPRRHSEVQPVRINDAMCSDNNHSSLADLRKFASTSNITYKQPELMDQRSPTNHCTPRSTGSTQQNTPRRTNSVQSTPRYANSNTSRRRTSSGESIRSSNSSQSTPRRIFDGSIDLNFVSKKLTPTSNGTSPSSARFRKRGRIVPDGALDHDQR